MENTEVLTSEKNPIQSEIETVEINKENAQVEEKTEETESGVLNEKQERDKATAIQLERRAEALMDALKYIDALADFRQALNYYRKINDRQSVGRCHYRMGHAYEQTQKYTEAVEQYVEAEKIFLKMGNLDDYATVSDRMAKTHYFNGKIKESVDEYKTTLELGCKNAEIFNNLGFIQISLEELEDAKINLTEALKLRENQDSNEIHMTYNNLGVIEFLQKNYDKAIEFFKKGIELDARDPKDDRTIQYSVFMKPSFKGEEFTNIRSFDDVNTKACLMLNMASALGMSGNGDKALETANDALLLDKDRAYLYESLGWIYINRGEEMRALDYFRRAVPYDAANDELKKIIDMINPYINIKTGRNDPCPCGSGSKYKKCHGKNV